jgi:hypothetical protein
MSDQSVHSGAAQTAADLELALRAPRLGEDGLDRRHPTPSAADAQADGWDLELRYSSNEPGGSGADVMSHGRAAFDLEQLDRHLHGGPTATSAYAELLTDGLFADPEVRKAFAVARTAAATTGSPLRVRLLIAPSAYQLHRLRWETLLDPESRTPLLMDSNVLFSRYLTSTDWRPVRLRMRSELSALLVIADPSDLADYHDPSRPPDDDGFAPIDVSGEAARARRGLGGIRTVELTERGQATLSNIVGQLRAGFDVVYLVCHGFIAHDEPQLLLERPDGTTEVVHGRALVQRLRELQHVPRLVVLASCRSAGHEGVEVARDSGAATALGPQLIEIGVPAVLAMQGDVSMATVEIFIPTFLGRLHEHGRIDQATTEARGEIRDRFDWWSPVLFMRLRTGRLWYSAGFGGSGFTRWPALLNDIFEGTCLPLLGPGMTDGLLGPRHVLARELADRYHYPLAPYSREDLPQVAQFLAIDQSINFPVAQLRDHLIDALRQRLLELATDDDPVPERFVRISRFDRTGGLLDDLVTEVWRRLHAGVADPFVLLAQLPLPLYVTTQPASLLEVALEANGKRPRTEVSRWNEDCPPSVFERDPDYRPSAEEPLIFHIFGHLHTGRSVVLREDDYFEFLTAVSRDRDAIPQVVRRAFVNSALLFLGFRAEDWDFRVLFHSIMQQEGGSRRKAHSHVAAQLDPEASLTSEPEGARRYLESYFRQPHDVSLYWGSVDSFMETLHERLEADLP